MELGTAFFPLSAYRMCHLSEKVSQCLGVTFQRGGSCHLIIGWVGHCPWAFCVQTGLCSCIRAYCPKLCKSTCSLRSLYFPPFLSSSASWNHACDVSFFKTNFETRHPIKSVPWSLILFKDTSNTYPPSPRQGYCGFKIVILMVLSAISKGRKNGKFGKSEA